MRIEKAREKLRQVSSIVNGPDLGPHLLQEFTLLHQTDWQGKGVRKVRILLPLKMNMTL